MDTYTTIEDFALLPYNDSPVSAEGHDNDDDLIRELVDADTKMGYGGYCIIS